MASDTKTKLLDSAELLFFENGIDATSTRNIADHAGTNNAAPNFHFGSKSNLIKAVFERRMRPLNERRAQVAAGYAEKGKLLEIESLIDVFAQPLFELLKSNDPGAKAFLGLLAQSTVMPIKEVEAVLSGEMDQYNQRYLDWFSQVLPELSKDELRLRIDYMIGAFAHAISDASRRRMMKVSSKARKPDYIYKTLKAFLVAGFKADSV